MKNILALLVLLLSVGGVASANSIIGQVPPTAVSSRVLSLYKNPPDDLISYSYKVANTPFWVVVINGGELLAVSENGTTLLSLVRSTLTFEIYEKGRAGYVDASSNLSQSYSAKRLPAPLRAILDRLFGLDALRDNIVNIKDLKASLSRSYNFNRAQQYWMIQTRIGNVIIDSDTELVFLTAKKNGVSSLLLVDARSEDTKVVNDDVLNSSLKDAVMSISNTIDFVAAKEQTVRYVFTDPYCGYCRKLHGEMADLNKKGITIRYIPINNFGDRSLKPVLRLLAVDKENQPNALSYMKTQLSSRQKIDYASMGSPVITTQTREQLKLNKTIGDILGVRGTPAIFDVYGQNSNLE
jgi:thiol-disulfide isomerase/thioredoxin